MPIVEILVQIVMRFGEILVAPLRHPDMLWIIIPIYLAWLTGDYFQERKITDFGNAATNSIVILWVGMDWARQSVKTFAFNAALVGKIIICAIFIIYGMIILRETLKARPIAHWIGRAREIGYFSIVATPIFYDVVPINTITIAAILLFFPVVYGLNSLWDRLLPAPPGEDESMANLKMPELDPSAGMQMPPMGKMPKF
jgi:hypothetical protein